jgi:hypothetical protein
MAKTKLAPQKTLPAEYRRARFWDGSRTGLFPAALWPLFARIFSGTILTPAKSVCHAIFGTVAEGLVAGERQFLISWMQFLAVVRPGIAAPSSFL